MELPQRISAFIYDFDDTIVESERFNESLFAEAFCRESGVTLDQRDLDAFYGRAWSEIYGWLMERYHAACDEDRLWNAFIDLKTKRLHEKGLRVATGFDRVLALPAKHAIVSGSAAGELALMFDAISLDPARFECIISDDDCANGKPHPDGYLAAVARLDVPPDEVLVFEDSSIGVEAAHRARLPVAFVAELASRDTAASRADGRFSTFLEAWRALRDRVGVGSGAS